MKSYKEQYIEAAGKTLPSGTVYSIGSWEWTCLTGIYGYAAFDAALKEKVYRKYMNLTDEEIEEKFKNALENLQKNSNSQIKQDGSQMSKMSNRRNSPDKESGNK